MAILAPSACLWPTGAARRFRGVRGRRGTAGLVCLLFALLGPVATAPPVHGTAGTTLAVTTPGPPPPPPDPPPPPNDPDVAAPEVVGRAPRPDAVNVSVGASVRVIFDETVVGVDGSTFTLEGPGGRVPADVSGAGRSWTLNPLDPLEEDIRYVARLASTGIEDGAGNAFAGDSWSFRTEMRRADDTTRPSVDERSPDVGERNVAVRTDVTVTFDEPVRGVDEDTFRLVRAATGRTVTADVFRRGAADRWTLRPDARLRGRTTYAVVLEGGRFDIRDLADNPLHDTRWSFVTARVDRDGTDPSVVARRPAPGATGVARRVNVRVVFDEAVRRVTDRTFRLVNARTGTVVSAEVFRGAGPRRWVLDPDARLRPRTRYVAVLRGGVFGIRDLAGNRLTTTRWGFRTGPRR